MLWPYWAYLGITVAKNRKYRVSCLVCGSPLQGKHLLLTGHCPKCSHVLAGHRGKWAATFLYVVFMSWAIHVLQEKSLWLLLFSPIFIGISYADIQYRKIPNPYIIMTLIVAVLFYGVHRYDFLFTSIVTGFFFCLFLLFVTRNQIGMGDLKMMLVLSIVFPWWLWMLFLFVSNVLALISKPIFFRKEKELPFGVFLSLGALFTLTYLLKHI